LTPSLWSEGNLIYNICITLFIYVNTFDIAMLILLQSSMDERQINNRLRSTLQRIHDSLIDDVHDVDNMEDPQHTEHRVNMFT
jgi:hypothetical protein